MAKSTGKPQPPPMKGQAPKSQPKQPIQVGHENKPTPHPTGGSPKGC